MGNNTRALEQVCRNAEMWTVLCENIDLVLDAGKVLMTGGEEADRLRGMVRELKIDLALRMEG